MKRRSVTFSCGYSFLSAATGSDEPQLPCGALPVLLGKHRASVEALGGGYSPRESHTAGGVVALFVHIADYALCPDSRFLGESASIEFALHAALVVLDDMSPVAPDSALLFEYQELRAGIDIVRESDARAEYQPLAVRAIG